MIMFTLQIMRVYVLNDSSNAQTISGMLHQLMDLRGITDVLMDVKS